MRLYFVLTYLFSWCIWLPLALTGRSNQPLFMLAAAGPSLIALFLTWKQQGWAALPGLLRAGARTHPAWWCISLLGAPLVMLLALGLHVALGASRPEYIAPAHVVNRLDQWPLVGLVFLYIFVFTALGEEIGWRKFALPALLARFSPFAASLLLGLGWALWHLPLFWMPGNFHRDLPLPWFMLQITGCTFLYTWFHYRTKGSLLVALLFHTSCNAAIGLLPVLPADNAGSLRPLWLAVLMLWLVVGLVVWWDRALFFNPPACLDERKLETETLCQVG